MRAVLKRTGPFLAVLALCAVLLSVTVVTKSYMTRLAMEQLAHAKSARVSDVISRLAYQTRMISALIMQGDGTVSDFQRTASVITADPSVMCVLIAPGGVVSSVYPLRGNETLAGHDLLGGGAATRESVLARDSAMLVMGGPFELGADRQGLLAVLPVFIDAQNGTQSFWGLVAVALEYPGVIDAVGLEELSIQGFAYEIYNIDPDSGEKRVITRNLESSLDHPGFIEERFSILNAEWYFRIYPLIPWYSDPYVWILALISLCLSFFVSRLQVMTIKAREASKAKSDFLASMSHEIRTPLNAVIALSELIALENLNERQREYADDIKTASVTLLGIINDILDVSKIESGKLELRPVHFSPRELTDFVASIMQQPARAKNLELVCRSSGTMPDCVYGDDVRLRQILINLTGNAVKFTESGSVELCAAYEDGTAVFTVTDTGIGIREADMERLFKPFEQLDGKRNRAKQGTGLGLSITKSLVGMMGGEIQVSSVYGKGTVFTVRIPLPASGEPVVVQSGGQTAVRVKNGKVLVCDDNEINRKAAAGLLRLSGIECDCARSGAEAIELVRTVVYDIVFMDHMMPEMDGVEATRRIRELGAACCRGGGPVIVALTANALPEARAAFESAGADDFLVKPVDRAALNAALKKWLPEEKLADGDGGSDVSPELRYAGSAEDYERMQKLLRGSIPGTLERMETALDGSEPERFAAEAHGLKGALAVCGHTALAETAGKLETAGKAKQHETCRSLFPEFRAALGDLYDALSAVTEEQKEPGNTELLWDTLAAVEECVARFDRNGALDKLDEISGYSFGGTLDETLSRLTAALEDFRLDAAAELIESIEI